MRLLTLPSSIAGQNRREENNEKLPEKQPLSDWRSPRPHRGGPALRRECRLPERYKALVHGVTIFLNHGEMLLIVAVQAGLEAMADTPSLEQFLELGKGELGQNPRTRELSHRL